ncbi:hypothetical protein KC968_00435 [Candidatus Saccharibacteria bacterium]|nr:hypothetical protein [Candidatus Saccharibacteria bacterium]
MRSENEQSLFDGSEYFDPTYYALGLALIDKRLPELDLPVHNPSFETWHDNGVVPFARDWQEVLENVTELKDISSEQAEKSYQELMTSGQYGKADTLARGVRALGINDDVESWDRHELNAGLAYVHVGLSEATLLPLSVIDEEAGEIVHKTQMKPKDFLGIYNMAMELAKRYPEELEQYLEYADSIHIEMLLKYPDIHDYTHRIWRFWGSDPEEEHKVSIYDRIKHRDELWRAQATETLEANLQSWMRESWFARAGVLMNFGRSTELINPAFVRSEFFHVYNQMNLSIDLPDSIRATSSMFVPLEYPKLTNLKSMVRELWQSDPKLLIDLESSMARREIEVLQNILEHPDGLDDISAEMFKHEIAQLALRLPSSDPNKKSIIAEDASRRVKGVVMDVIQAGATSIDRTIEQQFINLYEDIIDIDTLYIDIDRIQTAVIEDLSREDVSSDSFERVIGFISPICRLGEEFVDKYVSDEFMERTILLINSLIELSKNDEYYVQYYQKMREKLVSGVSDLFEHYWSIHEEYFS